MQFEKRKNKRFSVSQFLSITLEGEEFVAVSPKDISLGGLSCTTRVPVRPFTEVYLMISVPLPEGDEIIKIEGSVIHSTKEGEEYILGVKFLDLFESDKRKLEQYLKQLEETE